MRWKLWRKWMFRYRYSGHCGQTTYSIFVIILVQDAYKLNACSRSLNDQRNISIPISVKRMNPR